ncbi:glycosyltransferase family 39 protein [uncultured Paraglaciecola sp.]|uniref:ArnT family glycosyltransferase n=1 Tax=uncultured Paraglaciecola sp. TaxID=1765024 RepID=UPI0030DA1940|tara:strand:+ start:34 stop:1791 length:1758 start_codon:yes stop_codon:yes gene_type:complete
MTVSSATLLNRPHFLSGHNHNANVIWLLLLACSMILLGLGLRDPWPADEPRFALIAKDMVDSGQWFFPMRGGELYPDKPPIFMWSIAIFYALFGSLKLAFLVPSALAGIVTVLLVYDMGRRLWSEQIGWYAGLLLLATLQFTLQAKTAQIDAMVCCWITIGCYSLVRFLLLKGSWFWYFLAWFFMGLGIITKGVGFLPVLMLIPYVVLRLSKQEYVINSTPGWSWHWLLGPIVMLGAICLWFLPMLYWVDIQQNPFFDAYRDNILFKQTVTRYADSWHHVKPFWYYLTSVIPVFWLPLSLCIPWVIKPWAKAIRSSDWRVTLVLGWIVLLLIFFSISPGKRGVYILPALPMLALIIAPYLQQILQSKLLNWLLFVFVFALSLGLFLFGLGGQIDMAFANKLSIKYDIEPWAFFMTLGVIGLLISVFVVAAKKRGIKPFTSWVVFIPLLWIGYSSWGYQLLNKVKTPKNVFTSMADVIPNDAPLALINFSEQFILFSPYPVTHFGYHTPVAPQIKAAWRWQKDKPNGVILLDATSVTDCFDMQKALPVGLAHRVNWVVLKYNARRSTCAEPPMKVNEFSKLSSSIK